MGMTIEQAIKHAEEVGNGCSECAAEHRQLAEWLRKYQKIQEIVKNTQQLCSYGSAFIDIREVVEDGTD